MALSSAFLSEASKLLNFLRIVNKIGSSTEPCGTPPLIADSWLLKTMNYVNCLQHVRMFSIMYHRLQNQGKIIHSKVLSDKFINIHPNIRVKYNLLKRSN